MLKPAAESFSSGGSRNVAIGGFEDAKAEPCQTGAVSVIVKEFRSFRITCDEAIDTELCCSLFPISMCHGMGI